MTRFTRSSLPAPRTLFLIDGLGALISASCLGVILVKWEAFFGMPVAILYPLAAIAGVFAIYSLWCAYFFPEGWRNFLRAIATANFLYCLTTAGLVLWQFPTLTGWGLAYFAGEILLVLGLVGVEWRVSGKF